jgi:hypothetical protein
MKIKDIKSEEVREEAVRLTLENNKIGLVAIRGFSKAKNEDEALECELIKAFCWDAEPYDFHFWYNLKNGHTNTPCLKLPKPC